jgi:hypothetical protein
MNITRMHARHDVGKGDESLYLLLLLMRLTSSNNSGKAG